MSPDWSSDPDTVLYADFDSPQSMNLYSYVLNNPLRSIDSEGLVSCDPDTWDDSTNTLTAGACHLDLSDDLDTARQIAQKTVDFTLQVGQQLTNIAQTPGGMRADVDCGQ